MSQRDKRLKARQRKKSGILQLKERSTKKLQQLL